MQTIPLFLTAAALLILFLIGRVSLRIVIAEEKTLEIRYAFLVFFIPLKKKKRSPEKRNMPKRDSPFAVQDLFFPAITALRDLLSHSDLSIASLDLSALIPEGLPPYERAIRYQKMRATAAALIGFSSLFTASLALDARNEEPSGQTPAALDLTVSFLLFSAFASLFVFLTEYLKTRGKRRRKQREFGRTKPEYAADP